MKSATDRTDDQSKATTPHAAPGTAPAHVGEQPLHEVSARTGGGGGRGAASKKKQGEGPGKGKGRETRAGPGGKGMLSEEETMLQDAEADAAEEDDAMASPPRAFNASKGEVRSMEERLMREAVQGSDSGWKSPGSGAPLMARPGNPRAISMQSGHEYELIDGALKRSEVEADEAADSAAAPEGMEEEVVPPRKPGGPRDQHRGFHCAVTKQPITGARFTTRHTETVQHAENEIVQQHDVCQSVFEAMPPEQQQLYRLVPAQLHPVHREAVPKRGAAGKHIGYNNAMSDEIISGFRFSLINRQHTPLLFMDIDQPEYEKLPPSQQCMYEAFGPPDIPTAYEFYCHASHARIDSKVHYVKIAAEGEATFRVCEEIYDHLSPEVKRIFAPAETPVEHRRSEEEEQPGQEQEEAAAQQQAARKTATFAESVAGGVRPPSVVSHADSAAEKALLKRKGSLYFMSRGTPGRMTVVSAEEALERTMRQASQNFVLAQYSRAVWLGQGGPLGFVEATPQLCDLSHLAQEMGAGWVLASKGPADGAIAAFVLQEGEDVAQVMLDLAFVSAFSKAEQWGELVFGFDWQPHRYSLSHQPAVARGVRRMVITVGFKQSRAEEPQIEQHDRFVGLVARCPTNLRKIRAVQGEGEQAVSRVMVTVQPGEERVVSMPLMGMKLEFYIGHVTSSELREDAPLYENLCAMLGSSEPLERSTEVVWDTGAKVHLVKTVVSLREFSTVFDRLDAFVIRSDVLIGMGGRVQLQMERSRRSVLFAYDREEAIRLFVASGGKLMERAGGKGSGKGGGKGGSSDQLEAFVQSLKSEVKGVAQAMSAMNAMNSKIEARIDSFETAQSDQASAIAEQRNLLLKTRGTMLSGFQGTAVQAVMNMDATAKGMEGLAKAQGVMDFRVEQPEMAQVRQLMQSNGLSQDAGGEEATPPFSPSILVSRRKATEADSDEGVDDEMGGASSYVRPHRPHGWPVLVALLLFLTGIRACPQVNYTSRRLDADRARHLPAVGDRFGEWGEGDGGRERWLRAYNGGVRVQSGAARGAGAAADDPANFRFWHKLGDSISGVPASAAARREYLPRVQGAGVHAPSWVPEGSRRLEGARPSSTTAPCERPHFLDSRARGIDAEGHLALAWTCSWRRVPRWLGVRFASRSCARRPPGDAHQRRGLADWVSLDAALSALSPPPTNRFLEWTWGRRDVWTEVALAGAPRVDAKEGRRRRTRRRRARRRAIVGLLRRMWAQGGWQRSYLILVWRATCRVRGAPCGAYGPREAREWRHAYQRRQRRAWFCSRRAQCPASGRGFATAPARTLSLR